MRSSQENSQLSLFSSDSSQKSVNVTTVLPAEPISDFYSMQNPIIHASLSTNFRHNSTPQEYFTSSQPRLVDEKIYEVLKPVKHPTARHCSESSETFPASFSQSGGAKLLNCLKTSKAVDQADQAVVDQAFNINDMEMEATQPNMDLPLATNFSTISNRSNYGQENRRTVGVQTEHCLSISDLLNDSSRLEEYLTAKLEDHQFMQLVEKCSQVYDTIFRTME
ncbi:hypothetical protein LOAG_05748, partial [Loa loa]